MPDYHAWTHRPKELGGTDPLILLPAFKPAAAYIRSEILTIPSGASTGHVLSDDFDFSTAEQYDADASLDFGGTGNNIQILKPGIYSVVVGSRWGQGWVGGAGLNAESISMLIDDVIGYAGGGTELWWDVNNFSAGSQDRTEFVPWSNSAVIPGPYYIPDSDASVRLEMHRTIVVVSLEDPISFEIRGWASTTAPAFVEQVLKISLFVNKLAHFEAA